MSEDLFEFFSSPELAESFNQAEVPPRSRWSALLLYMHSILEYDELSLRQREELRALMAQILRERDYSEANFKNVLRQRDRILHWSWSKKLERAFLETMAVMEHLRTQNVQRVEEMRSLRETAIGAVSGRQSGMEETIGRIRTAFENVVAHMEQDTRDLVEMSYTDPLTKLNNRRAFDQYFSTVAHEYTVTGEPLSLLLMDIDHFKKFNDSYGHRVGDHALVAVGANLMRYATKYTSASGRGFFPARFGGEEFIVVLPGVCMSEAVKDAENLRALMEEYDFVIRDQRGQVILKGVRITVSIGVAELENAWGDEAGERLIDQADKALYRAKAEGRNRVCVAAG